MVNVNKPIAKGEGNVQSTPKRRPRNQELNSSKKTSGQGKLAALKKRKLNCSVGNIPAEYEPYYEVISEQEFADTVGTDVDNLREIVAEIENEYNEKVVGYLTAKTKYADAFVDANIDSGFITESGKVLNGSDEGYIGTGEMEYAAAHVDDEDSLDSACGDKADVDSSKELNCDASGISGAQDLLQKFVEDAASKFRTNLTLEWKPYSWKWSPEKKEIQYVIHEQPEDEDGDYTMSAITRSPSAVEEFADSVKTFIQQTVIPYLVDNAPEVDRIHGLFDDGSSYLQLGDFSTGAPDTDSNDYDEEFDSSCGDKVDADSSKKLNCDAEGDAEGDAKITTESGNEVSISDIQIIQNPDTNELSLFIKEDEDEEIPEGFVVIATATQAALPAGDICPNCGQEPCVCEEGELDSSKKKN